MSDEIVFKPLVLQCNEVEAAAQTAVVIDVNTSFEAKNQAFVAKFPPDEQAWEKALQDNLSLSTYQITREASSQFESPTSRPPGISTE